MVEFGVLLSKEELLFGVVIYFCLFVIFGCLFKVSYSWSAARDKDPALKSKTPYFLLKSFSRFLVTVPVAAMSIFVVLVDGLSYLSYDSEVSKHQYERLLEYRTEMPIKDQLLFKEKFNHFIKYDGVITSPEFDVLYRYVCDVMSVKGDVQERVAIDAAIHSMSTEP